MLVYTSMAHIYVKVAQYPDANAKKIASFWLVNLDSDLFFYKKNQASASMSEVCTDPQNWCVF